MHHTENHVHISKMIQRFIYIYKYDDDVSYRESCTYIKNYSEIYIYMMHHTENHVYILNIIQRFIYIYNASSRESCTYIKHNLEIHICI